MSLNSPFIFAGDTSNGRCMLCNESFSPDDLTITSDRSTLDKYCCQWANLDVRVCDGVSYCEFWEANRRLGLCVDTSNFITHKSCATHIRTRLGRKQAQSERLPQLLSPVVADEVEVCSRENRASRLRRQSYNTSCVRICFVCQQESNDKLSYNDGGIGRCELDSSKKKLTDSKDK